MVRTDKKLTIVLSVILSLLVTGGIVLASTITQILGTDSISDSRTVINTNFNNLNTDKVEIGGDISGSTSTPRLDIAGMDTGTIIVASTTDRVYALATSTAGYVLFATSSAPYISFEAAPWLTAAITSLNGLTGSTQTFATSTGINISSSGSTHTFNLRERLQELSGLGITKGNLIVGDGTDFVALGVGTDGYILTASSTATNGISWEAAAAGGGTAYNTFELSLSPAGAGTATSSPAGSNKYIGTNWTMHTLDYDGSTEETAFWTRKLPSFTALNECDYRLTVLADTVTTASSTVWEITYRPVGDNEDWDATTGEATASTSVSFTVVDRFYNASLAISTSSLASLDTVQFELSRNVAESDDTMTSDGRYVDGQVVCTYR